MPEAASVLIGPAEIALTRMPSLPRHDPLGPVIGKGDRTATFVHHLFGPLHDRGEGIDRNVHCHGEIVAAGVDIAATQFVLVGKADGVDDEIQGAPTRLQVVKQRVNRGLVANVTGQNNVRTQRGRKWIDPFFQGVALI